MRDYLLVIDLVARAGKGDKRAWDALVERYSPLIWSICRRHRLGDARLGIPVGSIGPACRRCLDKLRRDPVIAALTGAGTAPWPTPGRAGG